MKPQRNTLALAAVVVLVLLLALPSAALADNGGERISIFDSVTVGPGETINGDVGSIFSSVNVQGTVNGNVFSIFSSVNISGNGRVEGTATSVFSSVAVRNNAVVRGDVTSVFSTIEKDAAARIEGTQFSGPDSGDWPSDVRIDLGDWGHMRRPSGASYWVGRAFGAVFSALFLAAISVITVVLFPRRVQVVRDTLVRSPWSSLGVGFLGLLLSLPLALLLLITCIGFFVVILGTFLSTLLGLVALALWVGDRVTDTARPRDRSMVMDVAVGALILSLTMGALDLVPFIGWMSGLIWFGLWSASFGAVLLSRFGSMPSLAMAPAAPAVAPTTAWPTPEPPAPTDTPPAPPAPPAAA